MRGHRRHLPTGAVAVLLAAFLMTSCGDDDGATDGAGSSADSESSGTVEADAEYAGVDELRDAAVASGYTCGSWKKRQAVRFATEVSSCSWNDSFATFESEADVQKQIASFESTDDMLVESGERPLPHLVGPNWIITTADAETLQSDLGGEVVEPNLH
jgi:hypothetical protein